LNNAGIVECRVGLDLGCCVLRGVALVDQIKPGDRRGAADPHDAVNVDLVGRGGKRPVDDIHDLPDELGRHETVIPHRNVVQCNVGFSQGQGICGGKIKVKDVGDPQLDEFRDVLSSQPAALVNSGCYLCRIERR